METRIFGTLEVRAVDEGRREFEGVANTAALDDHGTVIVPDGARFSLPLPLLWMHDQETPVGEITSARLVGGQWVVSGRIERISEPGYYKDATDKAWQGLKSRLVRGLSIGFKPLKKKGNRFLEWAWRELSLVTIPSNQEATITLVRSAFDAAPGVTLSPGVSGTQTHSPPDPRRKMTTQEQLTQHENSRAAKVAQQNNLMERAAAEGRTLDETETETFDTLDTEIRAIDGHLTRLSSLVRSNAAAATPVNGTSTAAATQTRAGVPIVQVRTNEDPGLGYARYVMALVACNGNRYEAAEYARNTWSGDQGEGVALMHRAAVAAGTTTNATFASPLVQTNYLNDFLELLRPKTLIGRIPGLRSVPFNVSITSQTAGGSYSWVGQAVPTPVSNIQVAAVTLGMAKASGIIVISEELARSSQPSAQALVRDDMIAGTQQYLDGQFTDPAVAAVANVSPASITNGVAGTAASGTTEAAARADIRALIASYATAQLGLDGLVLLMGETVAFKLGTMVNAVGAPAFPGLGVNGGNILGIPVVTSNVTPLQTRIVALHAPSVMIADEGGTEIDISREATIIMDTVPATVVQAAAAAPTHTSMWQNHLVGLRSVRYINWGKARTSAVNMIHTVAY